MQTWLACIGIPLSVFSVFSFFFSLFCRSQTEDTARVGHSLQANWLAAIYPPPFATDPCMLISQHVANTIQWVIILALGAACKVFFVFSSDPCSLCLLLLTVVLRWTMFDGVSPRTKVPEMHATRVIYASVCKGTGIVLCILEQRRTL